ncbi:unnamed protein product [Cylicocyclus nassatus]|uniref:Uncharacterized protein n=1 Tax=Cylicocyclus nassatus TaxID=53992 RepID=A0AA36GKJ2_CYLNA|nr:unnamed protein product [Cylicocyclus nassatus]
MAWMECRYAQLNIPICVRRCSIVKTQPGRAGRPADWMLGHCASVNALSVNRGDAAHREKKVNAADAGAMECQGNLLYLLLRKNVVKWASKDSEALPDHQESLMNRERCSQRMGDPARLLKADSDLRKCYLITAWKDNLENAGTPD